MALHGTLNVNGHSIGSWEARRGDETITPGTYTYRTEVVLNGQKFTATVDHAYADGAAILASKTLATATNPDTTRQPHVRQPRVWHHK